MIKMVLRLAAIAAVTATAYSADLNYWLSGGSSVSYYDSSATVTQAAPFGWMSSQVTTSNNRWALPDSTPARAAAGSSGVPTADAMFASYWVGETSVSSYVNNTPFPTPSVSSTGSGSSGSTNYWGVAMAVPSNTTASTYNFGAPATSSSTVSNPVAASTGATNAWGVAISNPYGGLAGVGTPVRRFDAPPGVPEPSTYGLIGLGMVATALARRKALKK